MRLKNMALIAEVLGGVGIIVSILYLAYEVSQNSESMELSHHLTLSDQFLGLRQSVMENDNLARIIAEGNSDIAALESFERLQFESYLTSMWDIWENAHYMFEIGRIEQEAWMNWNRAICSIMAMPGHAEAWANGLHIRFGSTFVPIVNRCYEQSNLPTAHMEQ